MSFLEVLSRKNKKCSSFKIAKILILTKSLISDYIYSKKCLLGTCNYLKLSTTLTALVCKYMWPKVLKLMLVWARASDILFLLLLPPLLTDCPLSTHSIPRRQGRTHHFHFLTWDALLAKEASSTLVWSSTHFCQLSLLGFGTDKDFGNLDKI